MRLRLVREADVINVNRNIKIETSYIFSEEVASTSPPPPSPSPFPRPGKLVVIPPPLSTHASFSPSSPPSLPSVSFVVFSYIPISSFLPLSSFSQVILFNDLCVCYSSIPSFPLHLLSPILPSSCQQTERLQRICLILLRSLGSFLILTWKYA